MQAAPARIQTCALLLQIEKLLPLQLKASCDQVDYVFFVFTLLNLVRNFLDPKQFQM
jgi:hypothetical protein